jgi:hypothetical protein
LWVNYYSFSNLLNGLFDRFVFKAAFLAALAAALAAWCALLSSIPLLTEVTVSSELLLTLPAPESTLAAAESIAARVSTLIGVAGKEFNFI